MDYVVKFAKPYKFEGTEYKEIDLAEIENLTGENLCSVQAQLVNSGKGGGGASAFPQGNLYYQFSLAALALKKPIEFLLGLPANEALKVSSRVYFFLLGTAPKSSLPEE